MMLFRSGMDYLAKLPIIQSWKITNNSRKVFDVLIFSAVIWLMS